MILIPGPSVLFVVGRALAHGRNRPQGLTAGRIGEFGYRAS